MLPLQFTQARDNVHHFDYVCKELISNANVSPAYDFILIDEAQDFPTNFFGLCFHLARGDRDEKSIIWAYDELQNILDVKMRTPEQLFGVDEDGEPLIDLERAHTGFGANNIVLKKCCRNPREILTCAHALGFGVYRETKVQMLESKEHWRDVGYELESGICESGQVVSFFRPTENSPLTISQDQKIGEILKYHIGTDLADEVDWGVSQIEEFLIGGLSPEEILVISLDDRHAKTYFNALALSLM